MSRIYELKNGTLLVISDAGIRTIVTPRSHVTAEGYADLLRLLADAVERAGAATAPIHDASWSRSEGT